MLYALQTASANLRMTSFEPEPTRVVIDPECVEQRPLGASAWSKVEGREYDDSPKTPQTKKATKANGAGPPAGQKRRRTERLLPNESHRDREIRLQEQKSIGKEALEPF